MGRKVYFDFNILNDLIVDDITQNKNFKHKPYISVAHGEEFFKMTKNNCSESNLDSIKKKDAILRRFSKNGIIGPSSYVRAVCIIYKNFDDMINTSKVYDSTNKIKKDSEYNFKLHKEIARIVKLNNKECINYSNLSHDEIWQQKELHESLKHLNYVLSMRKQAYTKLLPYIKLTEQDFEKSVRRVMKHYDFKNSFNEYLRYNLWALESIIEILFNLLDGYGYNRDKNKRVAESSVYDTQHAINASFCDIFVTNDEHFLKKVKAVYWYLGVKTEVLNLQEYIAKYMDLKT